MSLYKYRVRNIKVANEAGDRTVILSSFLEDTAGNQFLSSGSIDLFDVRIPKSTLPGSGYAAFINGVVTKRISDKYKATLVCSGTNASNELTVSSTSGLYVGMGVTGPGLALSGITLSSILSTIKVKLSSTLARIFTGILTNEVVTKTGNITSVVHKAVTFTDAGDTVNLTAHGLVNGLAIVFSSITTTTGIISSTTYFVIASAANTFQLAATVGGAALPLTTNGTGVLITSATAMTGLSSTSDLALGMSISGTGIPDGTVISVITSSTTLSMSQGAVTTTPGGTILFKPSVLAATVTAVSPAILSESFRTMRISGTGIQQDTTISEFLTTSSIKVSLNATVPGSQTLTVIGDASFVFDPASWTLDLAEVTTLVSLINFANL